MPFFTHIISMCKDFRKSLRFPSNNQRAGKASFHHSPIKYHGEGGSQKSSNVSYNSQLVDFCPRRADLVLSKFYVVVDRLVICVTERKYQ